jgi:hypothetical protein
MFKKNNSSYKNVSCRWSHLQRKRTRGRLCPYLKLFYMSSSHFEPIDAFTTDDAFGVKVPICSLSCTVHMRRCVCPNSARSLYSIESSSENPCGYLSARCMSFTAYRSYRYQGWNSNIIFFF